MIKLLKNQSGAIDIILILVFLILVLGFGGYVYYRQQQNNVTYTSTQNGITVTKQKDTVNARDHVKAFYALWLGDIPASTSAGKSDELETKGYITKKANADMKAAQMYDLVSCSQNALKPSEYKYDLPALSGNTGTMTISGVYTGGGTPSTNVIKLDLIKSGSNWLINGFHCPTMDAQAAKTQ